MLEGISSQAGDGPISEQRDSLLSLFALNVARNVVAECCIDARARKVWL